jgi:hypothetical protein
VSGTVPYGPTEHAGISAGWLLSEGAFCIAVGELAQDISDRDRRKDDLRVEVIVFGHVATVDVEGERHGGPACPPAPMPGATALSQPSGCLGRRPAPRSRLPGHIYRSNLRGTAMAGSSYRARR